MANQVICHYGIKGMKWRKLKSVSPDDRKGLDNPMEGKDSRERQLWLAGHTVFHNPNNDAIHMPKPDLSVKDKPIDLQRMSKDSFRAARPEVKRPRQDHTTNLPLKNKSSTETKKKVEDYIRNLLKRGIRHSALSEDEVPKENVEEFIDRFMKQKFN